MAPSDTSLIIGYAAEFVVPLLLFGGYALVLAFDRGRFSPTTMAACMLPFAWIVSTVAVALELGQGGCGWHVVFMMLLGFISPYVGALFLWWLFPHQWMHLRSQLKEHRRARLYGRSSP